MHLLLAYITLIPLPVCLAFPSSLSATTNTLIILDTGVGHRSSPVPRWPTSLRSISTSGSDATILQEYGAVPFPNQALEPIGARDIAYSRATASLFLATGDGILRTSVNGSNAHVVIDRKDVQSIAVAPKCGKIYFGTTHDGYLWRANLDGSEIEFVRDVSQGIDKWENVQSFAAGILVDEDEELVYWTSTRGTGDGSIRRIPMDGGDAEDEVLLEELNKPKHLRIVQGMLYWCEAGRWSTSPTSLSRLKLPKDGKVMEPEVLVHSNHTTIFFEKDAFGETQTLGIQSFAISDEGDRLWFVMESAGRTMFAKLVEVRLPEKALKLMNEDTKDLGIPVGIEYVG